MRLVTNKTEIGNRLLSVRKKSGFTQSEIAEKAGISERTYADIERGTKNMRVDTLCRICESLNISPDYLLVDDSIKKFSHSQEQIMLQLENCSPKDKEIALRIIDTFLNALNEK